MKITILTIEAPTELEQINSEPLAVERWTHKAPRPKIAQMPNFRRVVRCNRQIYSIPANASHFLCKCEPTIGRGSVMTIISVTTSEIAKALCNMFVSTQCAFSTIVLIQYAEKSFPQMKTMEKKKAMVQLTMMESMNQVTQLKIGEVLLVKTRRYKRTKLDFTRPNAGT